MMYDNSLPCNFTHLRSTQTAAIAIHYTLAVHLITQTSKTSVLILLNSATIKVITHRIRLYHYRLSNDWVVLATITTFLLNQTCSCFLKYTYTFSYNFSPFQLIILQRFTERLIMCYLSSVLCTKQIPSLWFLTKLSTPLINQQLVTLGDKRCLLQLEPWSQPKRPARRVLQSSFFGYKAQWSLLSETLAADHVKKSFALSLFSQAWNNKFVAPTSFIMQSLHHLRVV